MASYKECFDNIKAMQKEAKETLEQKLMKKGVTVFPKRGIGKSSDKNDYSNYIWLAAERNGRTFWISMFYNDFDVTTYNFHTQYGRLQFSREASDIGCGSSNEVENGQLNVKKTLSNYKDPMAIMGDFTKNECLNGKWLTVDDIIHNEKACEATVEAFIKYMNEENDK